MQWAWWLVFHLEYPEHDGFWTQERYKVWRTIAEHLRAVEVEYALHNPSYLFGLRR